jgi:hypothetical protein
MKKKPCPGHEKVCKFCKGKYGRPRYVADMMEIDRFTGKPKVDFCCRACEVNSKDKDRFYKPSSVS